MNEKVESMILEAGSKFRNPARVGLTSMRHSTPSKKVDHYCRKAVLIKIADRSVVR